MFPAPPGATARLASNDQVRALIESIAGAGKEWKDEDPGLYVSTDQVVKSWSLAVAALAVLIVPPCGAVIALVRVRGDYTIKTMRILGTMFISTAVGVGIIGALGALLRGEQPIWPYLLITGLPALAVARIVQTESARIGGGEQSPPEAIKHRA